MESEVYLPSEDSLFVIRNDDVGGECSLYSYGEATVGHLDITVSDFGSFLLDVECVYASNNIRMDMHLDEREKGLRQEKYAHFYPPENANDKFCGPFQIAYTEKEMVVVLSANPMIDYFVRNGRVDFYYTEDDGLVCIRVRDLTSEEYGILC